jgi:Ecdysteroid kinase-like family
MTAAQLPRSVDDLDDAWASEVLGVAVTVTGREPVGAAAFACKLVRLLLDGPASAPASIVVKLPIWGELRPMLDAIGAYGREVRFYREIAPELPVRTPKIYAAEQASDSTDFVLVMEDLVDCTQIGQIEGFALDNAQAAVDGLARLHAWSWANDAILQRFSGSFWPITSAQGRGVQDQYGLLYDHVMSLRGNAICALLPREVVPLARRFTEFLPQMLDELATPACITHGELRADNLFFAPDGKPVFIDFQACQQEAGVRELAYLLCTSVPIDVMADHEDELIRRYCGQIPGYDYELARRQYRYATAYNLVLPIIANVRWDDSDQRGRDTLDDMVRKLGAAAHRNRAQELYDT